MSFISSRKIQTFFAGVLIILVLVAVAIGASFLSKKDIGKIFSPQGREEQRVLSDEEKKALLESLSAPGESNLSDEEKKAILESLSAPGESNLTDEEKRQILENLTAP